MNKSVSRALATVGAVAVSTVLLVATTCPAYAVVTKSGTKSCPDGHVGVHSYANGSISHKAYGLTTGTFYHSTWKVDESEGAGSGSGSWYVSTNGSLNDAGTYGVCYPGV